MCTRVLEGIGYGESLGEEAGEGKVARQTQQIRCGLRFVPYSLAMFKK